MIEKGEWLAFGVALQPQRDAAAFDREWILVHPIDAVRDHIAHRFPQALRRGFVLPRAHAREFLS